MRKISHIVKKSARRCLFETLENRQLMSAGVQINPAATLATTPDAVIVANGHTTQTFAGMLQPGGQALAEIDLNHTSRVNVKVAAGNIGETLTIYNSAQQPVRSLNMSKHRTGQLAVRLSQGTWYAGVTPAIGAAATSAIALTVSTAQMNAVPAATDPSAPFVINPVNITNFSYGGSTYAIYAANNNQLAPNNPQQWQFAFAPIMQPLGDSSGNPQITEQKVGNGPGYHVTMQLAMSNATARSLVMQSLQSYYPKQAAQSNPFNIAPVPLQSIAFDNNAAILAQAPGASIVTPINFGAGAIPDTTQFTVLAPSKTAADQIQANMLSSTLNYQLNFNAENVVTNSVAVTYADVEATNLLVNLSGAGGDQYVSRSDLRQVADQIMGDLSVHAVIQDPARFNNDITDKLLSIMQDGASHWFSFTRRLIVSVFCKRL